MGYPAKVPEKECKDSKCPFHGSLSIRGMVLDGIVRSARMRDTIVVERNYLHYVSKVRRYERRSSSISAHLPSCISVKEGDKVRIAECRPISKTISFVVIERVD